MTRACIACACAIAFALAGMAAARAEEAVVIGLVTDDAGPVRYAYVTVERASAMTGKDGRYRIAGVRAGRVQVTVDPPAHLKPEPIEVDLVAGKETTVDIKLDRGLAISGVVVDGAGKPVKKARIAIMEGPSPESLKRIGWLATEADGDGRFTLGGLVPGEYVLEVRGAEDESGLGFGPTPVQKVKAGTTDLRVVLGSAAAIAGAVIDAATGKPLPRSQVSVKAKDGDAFAVPEVASAEKDGRFHVGNLRAGAYTVRVTARGHAGARIDDVQAADGETKQIDVRLPVGAEIHGRVVAKKDRSPVAGVKVSREDWSLINVLDLRAREATTNADGRFVLPHFPAGRHRLVVDAGDRRRTTAEVEVPADATSGGKVELKVEVPGP